MKKEIIALTNFETVLPEQVMEQSELMDYLCDVHSRSNTRNVAGLVRRYAVKDTKIAKRYFENKELGASAADIYERTQFFGERGRKIMTKFYPDECVRPNHIVHVTCTGYISPSPAQHLVNDKDWKGQTNVTHAYHMGCYAALPAVRMTQGFVAAGEDRVDIVHTEMCSLHLHAGDFCPEQIVVQSLFADGHVKYSAVPQSLATSGFKVLNVREEIIKDSQSDMSWVPASWGMKMTLSRDVPEKIGANLRSFLTELARDTGYDLSQLLKNAIFAIHPGGPKIIDSVQQILELSESQVQCSKDILLSRGNMSSATLPHVWKKLMDDKIESGRMIVSLAFGPGLTIFGSVFQVI